MQQGPPRIVEPVRLVGQSPAVLLVVGQDVQHGLPLVGEAPVGLVQIAHDVKHRAALLVAPPQAALQRLQVRAEAPVSRRGRPGIRDRQRTIVRPGPCHRDLTLPGVSPST